MPELNSQSFVGTRGDDLFELLIQRIETWANIHLAGQIERQLQFTDRCEPIGTLDAMVKPAVTALCTRLRVYNFDSMADVLDRSYADCQGIARLAEEIFQPTNGDRLGAIIESAEQLIEAHKLEERRIAILRQAIIDHLDPGREYGRIGDFIGVIAETKAAIAMLSEGQKPDPIPPTGEVLGQWSRQDAPSAIAKKLGISLPTLKRQIAAGKIERDIISARVWRIRKPNLPSELLPK